MDYSSNQDNGSSGSEQNLSDTDGDDALTGGDAADTLSSRWGNDTMDGGAGDDKLSSRSDAGEPEAAQCPEFELVYGPEENANDTLTGGAGSDEFYFRLDINAKVSIAEKHTDENGVIDWMGVAGENNNIHDHWVDGIGDDVITDFELGVDKIVIKGHTVEVKLEQIDTDGDGVNDSTLIKLNSQQGDGGGAHDEDLLGTIMVQNALLTEDDIESNAGVAYGAFETIDELRAYAAEKAGEDDGEDDGETGGDDGNTGEDDGNTGEDDGETGEDDGNTGEDDNDDGLVLSDTDGDDAVEGGAGDDDLSSQYGNDTMNGGAGNDRLESESDSGEGEIAQEHDAEDKYYDDEPLLDADDEMTGGAGSDEFYFRLNINATAEIAAKHVDANGVIDWMGVAGENNGVHDHWVDGIGNDVIKDFEKGVDTINIEGHTVEVKLEQIDTTGDGNNDSTLIRLNSQQGDGGGAHDEDLLGTILVENALLDEDDIESNAGVAFGAFETLDELLAYRDAKEDDGGETGEDDGETGGDDSNTGEAGEDDGNTGDDGNTAEDDGEAGEDDGAAAYEVDDMLVGGGGNDKLISRFGNDTLEGGDGNDKLISRSDSGEPDAAQDADFELIYGAENNPDDTLTGGAGSDKFYFRLDISAKVEIAEKHTNANGVIDWMGVAGENNNVHDHWVDGIGNDVITDFEQGVDKIVIKGHTVEVKLEQIDTTGDGNNDSTLIKLNSQQGDGGGAHDEDLLGTITVQNALLTEDDLNVDAGVAYGAFRTIDQLREYAAAQEEGGDETAVRSNDRAILRDSEEDDALTGSGANDVLRSRWGNDELDGGGGNDRLVSRSDSGEPEAAQDPDFELVYGPEEDANDTLTGGAGRDKFYFRLDINAKVEIAEKHTNENGVIDWMGVAGENNNVHDHWVDGIGDDVITDFELGVDKIVIKGHTVEVKLEQIDTDGDGVNDSTLIKLNSQQGDGGGAHDEDLLGTITVQNALLTEDDLKVDAGVAYGAFRTIDQLRAYAEEKAAENDGAEDDGETGGDDGNTGEDDGETGDDDGNTGEDDGETGEDDGNTGEDDNDDGLVLSDTDGDDAVEGGAGDDDLSSQYGNDTMNGGAGNDRLESESDSGEGEIAQEHDAEDKYYDDEPLLDADDEMTGGAGSDEFYFRLNINATAEIAAKHVDANGVIDWMGVAGENNGVHDHWVDGIGNDVIKDFEKGVDTINIEGHTVEVKLEQIDTTGDGNNDSTLIRLNSQQGDGGGAHDEDLLGTILVENALLDEDDIESNAGVAFGAFETLDELLAYRDAKEDDGGETGEDDGETGEDDGETGEDDGETGEDDGETDAPVNLTDTDGDDALTGGDAADTLSSRWGNDTMDGGAGDDKLSSRSDAGEPEAAQCPEFELVYGPEENANDTLTGGAGSDEFYFRLDINAKVSIAEKHTDENGVIDWMGVAGENNNIHDHWVDGIGDDVITDFEKGVDKILIEGHTVEVKLEQVDNDGDGVAESTLIKLNSQQGDGGGAHDEDLLGTIMVQNALLTEDDIESNAGVAYGAFETIDELRAYAAEKAGEDDGEDDGETGGDDGNTGEDDGETGEDDGNTGEDDNDDGLVLSDTDGDDAVEGGAGDDDLSSQYGNDTMNGGAGNDRLESESDSGEGEIAQEHDAEDKYYDDEPLLDADDEMTGGAGSDEFYFRLNINATAEIAAKHVDANGVIDWMGVAGENNGVHDHWVDGIGNDVIKDFEKGVDTINIEGHTVEVKLEQIDTTGDGNNDSTLIRLNSQQGDGGGAHDEDLLGTILVENALLDEDDIESNAGVAFGAFETLDELLAYRDAKEDDGGETGEDDGETGEDDGETGEDDGETGEDDGETGEDDGETGEDDGETGEDDGEEEEDDDTGVTTSIIEGLLTPSDDMAAAAEATMGDDYLQGSEADDMTSGSMGDDLMLGAAGDDMLKGSWGDDRMAGEMGDDDLSGGQGDDLLVGGEGDDNLSGGQGDDIVVGGPGDDIMEGGQGKDMLKGGDGDDIANGGADDDLFYTGEGEDLVDGGSGDDVLALDGTIDDYTFTDLNGATIVTNAVGDADMVTGVEQFHFLGNGETYDVDGANLTLSADQSLGEELQEDALIAELLGLEASEEGTEDDVDLPDGSSDDSSSGSDGESGADAPTVCGMEMMLQSLAENNDLYGS